MATREANILVTLRDRASSGLSRLGGVASGLARAFGLVTAAATAVTAVVGARFFAGAIRSAGEFDEAMSTVGAVTQATAEEMEALRAAADEAGATTRFTATEAANGLEELARSGQNASEAIDTLNPVLQLAAGNNQTVAESAIQVTTALNAFGLASDDAARVSDVFTRAAQRSAQTTAQLGEAMTFVAPVARQAGIDIEQTAALIGRLADAGFRGSLGGTALRNAILQFQDPASTFRRELGELGIRTDDFGEALEGLAGAGDGAEAAIRSLGLRAGPAIQAIVAGGAPALRELTAELRNAEGASQGAAAALEDNLPGAIRGFASAFDAARRRLVEPLVTRITEEIQGLTTRLREFTASGVLEQFAQLLTQAFNTGVESIRGFLAEVDFSQARDRLIEFATTTRERISEFVSGAQDLRRSFQVITGAIQTFVGVVGTAFNALGTGIAGVVTATASVVQGYLTVLDTMTLGTIDAIGRARDTVAGINLSLQQSTREFAERTAQSFAVVQEGWATLSDTAQQSGAAQTEALDEVTESQARNTAAVAAAEEAEKRHAEAVERSLAALRSWDDAGQSAAATNTELANSGSEAAGSIDDIGVAADIAAEQVFRIQGAAGSLEVVTEEADRSSVAFNGLATAIQQASTLTQLDALSDQIAALANQGQLTEAEIQQLIRAINEQAAAMDSASSSTSRNSDAIRDLGGAAVGTADSLGQLGRQARGASQGARSLVQDMGAALSVWKDAGPDAARAVEDFVFQFNQIGLFTFEGARNRINRFVEGMERKFGPAEQAIKDYNESLRDTDRSTRGLADSTDRLNTATRGLSGAEITQRIILEVTQSAGTEITLSEQHINTIVQRVLAAIDGDGARTT